MAVSAAELVVRFSAIGAAQVKADIASVGEATEATAARSKAAGAVSGLAMLGIGAGILDMTKSMTEAGASYQQEMDFINALAGGTAQTAQMLQDEALTLDRTTIFSAQDIATGMEQLAREGFTPLQITGTNAMNSLIQNASNMAAALRISMPDASNMLGMTMRAYQIDVSQTAATTDILTEAALRSGKTADEFNTQLQFVEATAHQLGIPLQDVSAAVGELMSQNVPGAGQGLRAFLVGITAEGSTANKELTALGISAYDAQGNFIGLGPLIDEVNQALSHLSPEEQSAAVKALSGGNRQVTALIQLLKDGSGGLTDFETKMGTLGGAAHVMSSLMDNAAGSLKAFASSLETAKILIGESFLPLLRPVTDGLRGVLGAFIQGPPFIHAFAAAAIAGTGALLTLAGAFALFDALDMGAAIGGIVTMFGSMASAIVPVIAIAGAFYLAWRTNFLGFRTLITGAVTDAARFGAAVKKAFAIDLLRTDPIAATLAAISSGFAALNLQGISLWFDRLSVSSHAVYLQLAALAQQVLPPLTSAWRELTLANDHVVTGMQHLLAGDLPGALRQWRAALTEVRFAWDDVSTAMSKVATATGGIVATIGSWVLNVGIPTVVGDVTAIASTVWDWVQNTAWPAVQGAARTLGSLAVQIGGWLISATEDVAVAVETWIQAHIGTAKALAIDIGQLAVSIAGWLVSAAEDIGVAVGNWIQSHIGAAKALAIDVGRIALSIAGWLVNATEDIGVAVGNWIQSHIGAAKSLAIDIGQLAVSIAGWLVNAAEDIGVAVGNWVQSHVGAAKALAIDIGQIAVSIAGWLVSAITDIAVTVGGWIQSHLGGIKGLAIDIGQVAVSISGWLVTAGTGLWEKVSNAVQVDWESASGSPIKLPVVDINVNNFNVKVDTTALWNKINSQVTLSGSDAAMIHSAGKSIGENFVANLLAGFGEGAGSGGGGLGGAAKQSVITGVVDALFAGIFDGINKGLIDHLGETINAIDRAHTQLQNALNKLGDLTTKATGFAGLGNDIKTLGNAFGDLVQGIADVPGAIKKVSDAFSGANLKTIGEYATNFGDLGKQADTAKTNISGFISALANMPHNESMLDGLIGQFDKLGGAIKTAWDNLLGFNNAAGAKENPNNIFSQQTRTDQAYQPTGQQVANAQGQAGQYGANENANVPATSKLEEQRQALAHLAATYPTVTNAADALRAAQTHVWNTMMGVNDATGNATTGQQRLAIALGDSSVAADQSDASMNAIWNHINQAAKAAKGFSTGISANAGAMRDTVPVATTVGSALGHVGQQAAGAAIGMRELGMTGAIVERLGARSIVTAAGMSQLAHTGGVAVEMLGKSVAPAAAGITNLAMHMGAAAQVGVTMGWAIANAGGRAGIGLGYFLSRAKSEIPPTAGLLKGLGQTATQTSYDALGLAHQLGNVGQSLGPNLTVRARQAADAALHLGGALRILWPSNVTPALTFGATAVAGLGTAMGRVAAQAGVSATAVASLGRNATTGATAIGAFASRTTTSVAATAAVAASVAAAGQAIGRFASQATASAASTAIFAAQLASIRSQVTSFAAGLSAGMNQAVAAVLAAGNAIRAAVALIGLSLASSGQEAGLAFAAGLGAGALQAAALMAEAGNAIISVAASVAAQLGAAGTDGGLAFAAGLGAGALEAAAEMASAGAAIAGVAASIMGELAADGAAAGASFAAGIAAGMAEAEGAAAAGVGAIVAICSGVDLFGPGFATGASFGAGVAAGLESEEGAVAAAAANIVASAAAASAAAAGIHSPSRLFRDMIGIPIAQGVAVGMQAGIPAIQRVAADLVALPSLPAFSRGAGMAAGGVAVSAGGGALTIDVGGLHVHVDGSNAHDTNELAAAVAEKLGPVLVHVANQLRRGQGALR